MFSAYFVGLIASASWLRRCKKHGKRVQKSYAPTYNRTQHLKSRWQSPGRPSGVQFLAEAMVLARMQLLCVFCSAKISPLRGRMMPAACWCGVPHAIFHQFSAQFFKYDFS